jgi:hypothetical protein
MNNLNPEQDEARTAYHEASHAIVALHLGVGIEHITILPEGDIAGHTKLEKIYYDLIDNMTTILPSGSPLGSKDKYMLENIAKISFGGMVGEKKYFEQDNSKLIADDNEVIGNCLNPLAPCIVRSLYSKGKSSQYLIFSFMSVYPLGHPTAIS